MATETTTVTNQEAASSRWPAYVWACRLVAAVLLFLALVVVTIQVNVTDAAAGHDAACGSALDVIADRTDWRDWRVQDLSDVDVGLSSGLVRTVECPDAVNARIFLAGGLTALAVAIFSVGEFLKRRSSVGCTPRRESIGDPAHHALSLLGTAAAGIGFVGVVAGIVALLALTIDSDSPLLLYVSRPVVFAVGLVLLMPTIGLVVIGLMLRAGARQLDEARK